MRSLVFVLLFVISSTALASPKAYFTHSGRIFASDRLKIGDKDFSYDWGFYNFAEAVKSDPIAYKYALKHRTLGRVAQGVVWGSLLVGIAYLIASHDDVDKELAIYFGTVLSGAIIGACILNHSRKYLHKSINHFNGLEDKKEKRLVFARYNFKF